MKGSKYMYHFLAVCPFVLVVAEKMWDQIEGFSHHFVYEGV